MNIFKMIIEKIKEVNYHGDEVYDTVYKRGYRTEKGHVEKTKNGWIWVVDKKATDANEL